MKRIMVFIALLVTSAVLFKLPQRVFAQAAGKGIQLDKELSHFKDKGAKGYLIWQYSGDRNAPLGDTDKWSIFRDDLGDAGDPSSVCGAMKKWSGQYEFLGFNVYSLGQGRGGSLSSGQIADQLNVLKGCGTNVVRVFISRSCPGSPSATGECVKRMLAGAQSAGVKLILAVGDFANGGGGFPSLGPGEVAGWYGGGYLNSQWPEYLRQTVAAAAGSSGLYGIELSNEAHCFDVSGAVAGYNQWASYGIKIAKDKGITNVGIGQMASNANSSCDAAGQNLLPGNQAAGATMVSAHYYTDDERDQADAAADKVVPSGLKFYIGESALLGLKKFPPSGPIMDSSVGIEPKFEVETRKIESGNIGTQKPESIHGFESSDFADATQTNFIQEDNKFSEIFDPNTGGGELVQSTLQGNVIYPDEQENYTGYKEVYGAGKYFATIADKTYSCEDSRNAAQSTSPDPYTRTQAHYRNFVSIRVPGPENSSGLQWQAQQPHIIDQATGSSTLTLTEEYYNKLKGCSEQVTSKPVPAVATPVEGFFQALASTIQSIVTQAWNSITDTVCDPDGKTNCHTVIKGYGATLAVNKTATIFLPGVPDIEAKALGLTGDKKGALLTFFPSSLTNKLSQNVGFTNKNESGNVLGDSTDSNAPDSIPHYQMHEVKYAFQRTSSCMLLPASVQQQRGTDCKLEGGGGAAPTQAPSATAPSTTGGDCRNANDPCAAANIDRPAFGNLSCNYNMRASRGSPSLQQEIFQAANYFGVPPQVLYAIIWAENSGQIFQYGDTQIIFASSPNNYDQASCTPNSCGAVGPVQLSIQAGFNAAKCPGAQDNWHEWCTFRTGAADIRGQTGYQGNPANILDSLAALAKLLKNSSHIGGCSDWDQTTVNSVITGYYGSCSDNNRSISLYGYLVQDGGQAIADSLAKNTPSGKALTYCDFVWGYYQSHK